MARPRKGRRVCVLPAVSDFGPKQEGVEVQETIYMTVEEYETIRLMDYERLNQVQCSEAMEVARSTVQRIYELAREKVADALVNGKNIKITGGDYQLCTRSPEEGPCDHRYCQKNGKGHGAGNGQGFGQGHGNGQGQGRGRNRGRGQEN